MRREIVLVVATIALTGALGFALDARAQEESDMKLTSDAFETGKAIPLKYSAYGDNISPKLTWSNLPDGTKQLALICDDPIVDMPQPFVHWVIYNIPATAKGLPEALPTDAIVAAPEDLKGATQGNSGLRSPGYFGPRPPADGKDHEYHFKLYALDAELNLAEGLDKAALLKAMETHVLGTTELVGLYKHEE